MSCSWRSASSARATMAPQNSHPWPHPSWRTPTPSSRPMCEMGGGDRDHGKKGWYGTPHPSLMIPSAPTTVLTLSTYPPRPPPSHQNNDQSTTVICVNTVLGADRSKCFGLKEEQPKGGILHVWRREYYPSVVFWTGKNEKKKWMNYRITEIIFLFDCFLFYVLSFSCIYLIFLLFELQAEGAM